MSPPSWISEDNEVLDFKHKMGLKRLVFLMLQTHRLKKKYLIINLLDIREHVQRETPRFAWRRIWVRKVHLNLSDSCSDDCWNHEQLNQEIKKKKLIRSIYCYFPLSIYWSFITASQRVQMLTSKYLFKGFTALHNILTWDFWLVAFVPCKIKWISESRKHLLVESGIQEIIDFGIRKPEKNCLWNPETYFLEFGNPGNICFWNPESTELESWIQFLRSRVNIMEYGIQDCHGNPLHGATR